jgi:quinol monooxygenase YgiN
VPHSSPSPALLVLSRFSVPTDPAGRTAFLGALTNALDVLGSQAGCRAMSLAQSTDDATLMLVRSEWDSVGAYRRALSAYDVKLHAIPLLSQAIDEPSAFEVVRDGVGENAVLAVSGLAADAGEVSLGSAAGEHVPGVGA